jgi:hypothetical protein
MPIKTENAVSTPPAPNQKIINPGITISQAIIIIPIASHTIGEKAIRLTLPYNFSKSDIHAHKN